MNVEHIDIGKDFASSLGPRYRVDGEHSGEEFREELLEPAYAKGDTVVVHLDTFETFSPSFFEEAFGGLARIYGAKAVLAKVRFDAVARAYLIPMIEEWIREADGKQRD